MRRVILESPYAGDITTNVAYARRCLRDSLLRGEAPLASHLLYTQPGVLDDADPDERALGIRAGLVWGPPAAATVVYWDLGFSSGMMQSIERARCEDRYIEFRRLDAVTSADAWNARYPVGTKVRYWPLFPPTVTHPPVEKVTRSEAWDLPCGRRSVVLVGGRARGVSLEHIEVIDANP
jgi:hypothetical protein